MEPEHDEAEPRTLVTLVVRSDDLDPDTVTGALGLSPDRVRRKGEHPHNNPKYRPYPFSTWSFDSTLPKDDEFEAHLEHMLAVLEPKRDAMLTLSAEHDVYFYCSLFDQSGLSLPPTLLKRIGELGARLDVSVYPYYDDEAEPETNSEQPTLDDLVDKITPENRHSETGTGNPVGNEVW